MQLAQVIQCYSHEKGLTKSPGILNTFENPLKKGMGGWVEHVFAVDCDVRNGRDDSGRQG